MDKSKCQCHLNKKKNSKTIFDLRFVLKINKSLIDMEFLEKLFECLYLKCRFLFVLSSRVSTHLLVEHLIHRFVNFIPVMFALFIKYKNFLNVYSNERILE